MNSAGQPKCEFIYLFGLR